MKKFVYHTYHDKRRSGDLTVGERAADALRNSMGSWSFVIGFLLFMLCWAYLNSKVLGTHAYDPYPFILLNLFLSMLAGLQGAILLIAAKRADAIMDAIIQHIRHSVDRTEELMQENTELTRNVHQLTTELHQHIVEGK